jgi:hypothetical protein
MDFPDLSTFTTNVHQIDPNSISEPHSTAEVHLGEYAPVNHPPREHEDRTGAELPDPSGSWHTSSWPGMIRPNLWNKRRPPELIEQEDHPDSMGTVSNGAQALPRSMLNLLSLEDILAIEDHGHVVKVRPEQVEKLAFFMAKTQQERNEACPPSCRGMLSNPKIMNSFVQLYFEHFHWTFPLLHRPTFNVVEEPPLLLLATAAIGSRFSKIPQAYTLTKALGDILCKAINNTVHPPNLSQSPPT